MNNVVPDFSSNQNFGNGGTITNVNLQDGVFQQGKGTTSTLNQSGGQAIQKGGSITNLNLSGGSFTQQVTPTPQARNAQQSTQARSLNITTLTQSGGSFTQQSGTIGTANLNGGSFTQLGGEITDLNLNGGAFNQQGGTLANLTQATGSSTISGKITTFTQNAGSSTIAKGGSITTLNLKSGSLTNNGSIETLTSGSGTTTQTRSATTATSTLANAAFRNAQDTRATAIRHITNNGTLDSLTLTEPTDVINVLNDDGKPIGIIKALDVKSGSSTINTLTGVAQNDKTGISSITIGKGNGGGGGSGGSNGAKLTVDTLRVGLQGNTAIQRVTINGDDFKGTGKEFAAKTVQIAYLNGKFDPNTKISTNLKDYVTEKSQNYVDSSNAPVFTISPQART